MWYLHLPIAHSPLACSSFSQRPTWACRNDRDSNGKCPGHNFLILWLIWYLKRSKIYSSRNQCWIFWKNSGALQSQCLKRSSDTFKVPRRSANGWSLSVYKTHSEINWCASSTGSQDVDIVRQRSISGWIAAKWISGQFDMAVVELVISRTIFLINGHISWCLLPRLSLQRGLNAIK